MWPSVFPLLAGAVLRMIGGVKTSNSRQAGLGLFRATGIYVGAILGSGILVLPAIAAREAGPASLLAWALLLVFCTPVAFSFAEMSRQQPDAGGIAHFVTRAYGRRASAVAGYLFYFAIPFGAPATAVIGGNYIAHALGGGRGTALVAAALLLAAAFAGNAVGIRMSSGIQLVLMVLLVGLLALAVALAAPYARAEHFEPFAPHGYWAVGGVASLLFFCFAGWEAVTHLAGEFRHPERDLKRATWLTLVVVGVVYLGVAAASVAVLGPALPGSDVPIAQLLEKGLGGLAAPLTAVAAAVLTFGPINTFVAGASSAGCEPGVRRRAAAGARAGRRSGPGAQGQPGAAGRNDVPVLRRGRGRTGRHAVPDRRGVGMLHGRDGVWAAGRDPSAARQDARLVRRYGGRRCDAGGAGVQRLGARGPAGAGRGRRLGGPPGRPEGTAVRLPGNANYCGAVGGGPAGGGPDCCAASCPALTVASIIEVMNRVAISSSSGVNSAIAAAMWRASGWNMAPPSR